MGKGPRDCCELAFDIGMKTLFLQLPMQIGKIKSSEPNVASVRVMRRLVMDIFQMSLIGEYFEPVMNFEGSNV